MQWYKYLEECHINAMLSEGCIKISELSVYRDIEKLGAEIGDENENTKFVYSDAPKVKRNYSDINAFERKFIGVSDPDCGFLISNAVFGDLVVGPRYFAYCVSGTLSNETLDKLNFESSGAKKQSYDGAVKIISHIAFTKALKKFLEREYGFRYIRVLKCNYHGRRFSWERDLYSVESLKDKRYEYQDEYRIIFLPPSNFDQSSLILKIPEIRKYIARANLG